MLQEVTDLLQGLLGLDREAADLGAGQMALRAVIVYAFALVVVRLGSKRFLGKATAFDVVLGIIVGSVISRAITASSAFFPTLVAGAVLVGMHWVFAAVAFRTSWFGPLVKGEPRRLIEDGEVQREAMRAASLTENDLNEALRHAGHPPDPSRIRLAHLERDGSISVVPREREARVVEVTVRDGVQTVRIEIG